MPRKSVGDSGNIKVCVRVRPFIKLELSGERKQEGDPDLECCVSVSAKTSLDIWKDGDKATRRSYDFDRVYWSHRSDHALYATQETLQAELGDDILTNAIDGFNNCIFAYGQTGSGKSYSVLGGPGQERGLLPRVVEGLFEHIGRLDANTKVCVSVSFLEIYNEKARDLLVADNGVESSQKLEVKQHPVLGIIVPGLTEAPVENSKEVTGLIEYGSNMRHVGETSMNAASSRSHCVFIFRTSLKDEATEECKRSQTNLVDLAGSERAKRTKAEGSRLKEGANINQSLSVLARVISSLAESKAKSAPFRESKLTYLLKESLSGNSKTVMMAAISPSNWDYDETVSTLKFAQSVKLVRTSAKQNKSNDQSIERQLRAEADKLRERLQQITERSGDTGQQQIERAQKKLEEQEALLRRYAPGGWEELVEKTRKLRRSATQMNNATMMDPKLRDVVADFYKRNPTISFKIRDGNDSDASSSHALFSSESGSDEEEEGKNDEEDGDDDDDGQVVLVFLPGDGDAGEGSASKRGRRSIAIQGQDLMGQEPKRGSEELTVELERLQAEVAEAVLLARKLSPPGAADAVLRASVAVDMERQNAHLVVRAERQSMPTEWVCADEFALRHGWLHDRASAGGGLRDAAPACCAWSASSAAVRARGEEGAAALLRQELAEARAELSRARAELQQDELLVARAHGGGTAPAPSPFGDEGAEEPANSSELDLEEALSALDGLQAAIENSGARRRQWRAS